VDDLGFVRNKMSTTRYSNRSHGSDGILEVHYLFQHVQSTAQQ
jgi:hypothetical protein